ncbi:hypothetical protein [Streptomyces sp. cg40]|uniref:hypothetical protein n=1 Tax=Streptomyces sp. cg40 TaxID=3419764 RepID=UPI003CFDA3C4
MSTFLTQAKANNTVPDVIACHELQGSANIPAHVAAYRAMESSLGISPRPIGIEEYGTPSEMGDSGALIGYAAKFERAGVHDAKPAFWNHYGTLGDTLTDTGRTTAFPGPIAISDTDYPVSNGSITVPVTMNAADSYHVTITPIGTSTSLAGRYQITNRTAASP